MDDMTILQVPIDKDTLTKAKKRAKEMGFSSIQGLVRYLLKLTAAGRIEIKVVIKQ